MFQPQLKWPSAITTLPAYFTWGTKLFCDVQSKKRVMHDTEYPHGDQV